MGLALVKDREANGFPRKNFEAALLQIGDIARISEQKLTLKVDERIKGQFTQHKDDIEQAKNTIKRIKRVQMLQKTNRGTLFG